MAFSSCGSLILGDAPSLHGPLGGKIKFTVYYLPGTIGWGPTFGDRPTALWNPVQWLIAQVDGSVVGNPKPLVATLWAALGAVERGNLVAAANAPCALQNKVRVQVADPAMASQFIEVAQQVINALQVSP